MYFYYYLKKKLQHLSVQDLKCQCLIHLYNDPENVLLTKT